MNRRTTSASCSAPASSTVTASGRSVGASPKFSPCSAKLLDEPSSLGHVRDDPPQPGHHHPGPGSEPPKGPRSRRPPRRHARPSSRRTPRRLRLETPDSGPIFTPSTPKRSASNTATRSAGLTTPPQPGYARGRLRARSQRGLPSTPHRVSARGQHQTDGWHGRQPVTDDGRADRLQRSATPNRRAEAGRARGRDTADRAAQSTPRRDRRATARAGP